MSLNINLARIRESVYALNREALTEVQRNVQLLRVASEARTNAKANKRKKAVFGRKVLGPTKYRSTDLWEKRTDIGLVEMSDEPDVKKSNVCQQSWTREREIKRLERQQNRFATERGRDGRPGRRRVNRVN